MTWELIRTDTFLDSLRSLRQNKEFLAELQKRLLGLREDPLHTGGWLSGSLKGEEIDPDIRKILTYIHTDRI